MKLSEGCEIFLLLVKMLKNLVLIIESLKSGSLRYSSVTHGYGSNSILPCDGYSASDQQKYHEPQWWFIVGCLLI